MITATIHPDERDIPLVRHLRAALAEHRPVLRRDEIMGIICAFLFGFAVAVVLYAPWVRR